MDIDIIIEGLEWGEVEDFDRDKFQECLEAAGFNVWRIRFAMVG